MDAPVTSITIGDVSVPPMTQEGEQQRLDPLTYHAEAVQGDVKAQMIIRHYGDARYPGGYLLDKFFLRTNEDATGRMGYKQEARARALLATLERRVEAALLAAGWVKRWKTPQDADLWLYVGVEEANEIAREREPQPAIAIDYDRMKANVPGRLAGLEDQGMFASAWMDPVEHDQWPRGIFIPHASVLVYHYERVARQGSMGTLQAEQGRRMCQRLRERLPDELRAAGWQVVSQTRDGQDIWQHRPGALVERKAPEQDDQDESPQESQELPDIDLEGTEPVAEVLQEDEQMEQTPYQGQQSHVVEVIGSEEAKLRGQQPAYSRVVSTRAVTFTCVQCGQTVTQQRYPGHTPAYCSDFCKGERQLEQTRERVARLRERRRQEQEGKGASS